MTKIKLSTLSVKYESDAKTYVRCILRTVLKIDKREFNIKPIACFAILKDNDKFDYIKGCKISLAKAERKAYKHVINNLKKEYNNFYNVTNALNEFIFKGENIISHNTEYIKNIAKD